MQRELQEWSKGPHLWLPQGRRAAKSFGYMLQSERILFLHRMQRYADFISNQVKYSELPVSLIQLLGKLLLLLYKYLNSLQMQYRHNFRIMLAICHLQRLPEKLQILEKRLDQQRLDIAIAESMKEAERFNAKRFMTNLTDLKMRMCLIELDDFWTVAEKDDSIMFFNISMKSSPKILSSIVISSEMSVTAHVGQREIFNLGKYTFPLIVNNIVTINEILSLLKSIHLRDENSIQAVLLYVEVLLNSIKCNVNEKYEQTYSFILEQLKYNFSKKCQIRYSLEVLVFSSLLFYMSPHSC